MNPLYGSDNKLGTKRSSSPCMTVEGNLPRQRKPRGRGARSGDTVVDIEPIVNRTLRFLENSPRGASRVDILAAMGLQPSAWADLRGALEDTGKVVPVGRGPGLRHVHIDHLDAVPIETRNVTRRSRRSAQLDQARAVLREVLAERGEIDSAAAQEATGLRADPVRRLLLELVDQGKVERFGKKRSTRYRWVG
jgi:hypothetical protein